MNLESKEYGVKVCSCGVEGCLHCIDGYWTDPRIHCNNCGAWCIGNSRGDVVRRWNDMMVKEHNKRLKDIKCNCSVCKRKRKQMKIDEPVCLEHNRKMELCDCGCGMFRCWECVHKDEKQLAELEGGD